MKLSFVIPCYKSENTITLVCNELLEYISQNGYEYEIILVNDNSPDNVSSVLRELSINSNIKVIELAKNMGKHAALMAGFRFCNGDIVVCLDDDGQCPVDNLSELLKKLDEGYDVATAQYGVKAQSLFKNFGSYMNAIVMNSLIGKPKDLQFSNFTVLRKFIVDEIVRYENPYPYINGLILRATKNIANVPMKERKRQLGKGNFTLKKSFSLWMNGFTAFSVKPLRLSFFIGIAILLISGMSLIADIIYSIVMSTINLLLLVALFMLLCIALLFIIMGLLGEYIGRIYISINNSPQYVIKNKINL
ncbi:MAG: glycosyltransferase family 2 protein [Lachnospiraceae bacterium]|nr:glycosyltransferase family 2 protein [Lachnospiraceae bacterium]